MELLSAAKEASTWNVEQAQYGQAAEKIDSSGVLKDEKRRGHRRSGRMTANVALVRDLICNKEWLNFSYWHEASMHDDVISNTWYYRRKAGTSNTALNETVMFMHSTFYNVWTKVRKQVALIKQFLFLIKGKRVFFCFFSPLNAIKLMKGELT